MFTLEQKIFIVQCYFRNWERFENGEEFQQKFPEFQGTYQQLALIILFFHIYLKNNVFKNRPGTIPELMQAIIDICNLIDVRTLQR
jgi:hypothetical protein